MMDVQPEVKLIFEHVRRARPRGRTLSNHCFTSFVVTLQSQGLAQVTFSSTRAKFGKFFAVMARLYCGGDTEIYN